CFENPVFTRGRKRKPQHFRVSFVSPVRAKQRPGRHECQLGQATRSTGVRLPAGAEKAPPSRWGCPALPARLNAKLI
ncbi:MAG: hypothetical protein V3R78_06990, partial [Thermodesulfobacteriota bacterium]